MLQEIYKFAINKNIVSIPNYKYRPVSVYVLLNSNGEYIGLETVDDKNGIRVLCPDIDSINRTANKCNPIIAKEKHIFIKSEKKHLGFIEIMFEASKYSKNAKIIFDFMNEFDNNLDLEKKVLNDVQNSKLKLGDNYVSFKIDNIKIEDDNSWKPWFDKLANKINNSKTSNNVKAISLISGEQIIPMLGSTPKINSGVFGKGVPVISFDKKSFHSYGIENNSLAPMSEEEVNIIKSGIEFLTSDSKYFNKNFGLIHFYDSIEAENNDLILDLFSSEEEITEENIEILNIDNDLILSKNLDSTINGDIINDKINNTIFHLMYLYVTEGRYSISRYKKGTCKQLNDNIKQWYKDTTIVSMKINEDNSKIIIYPFLKNIYNIFFQLMEEKNAKNKNEQINKEFGQDKLNLLFSIIENNQIPLKVYKKAIFKIRKEMLNEQKINKCAIQIIKTYLIREQRKKGENITIMESLNQNETNIAYNCGRLFAIYESLQQTAQGNLNSNITDNYFPSAQSNPSIVFGRLAKLSNYHLSKLSNKPQLKVYYSKKIQEIAEKISNYPKTLNIQEQGMFALGYYHQKFENYKPKEEGEK